MAAFRVEEDADGAVDAATDMGEEVEADNTNVAVDDDDKADAAVAADGGISVENDVVWEWTLPFGFADTEPNDLILSGFIIGVGRGEGVRCRGVIDGLECHR